MPHPRANALYSTMTLREDAALAFAAAILCTEGTPYGHARREMMETAYALADAWLLAGNPPTVVVTDDDSETPDLGPEIGGESGGA